MNDTQIDRLIARRERLTNRRDGRINRPAVAEIDALLREVPPGQRNDVDLLLGRMCAVLPQRNAAAVKWSSDEQRAKWQAEGAQDLARLAAYMGAAFDDWRHGERGAGCAGNSADAYDSSTEGHW